MLTTNGCVRLGTDLFNHSKGLFSNKALDKFSECQYNCPSMFKSGWTLPMVGRTYQVKTRQRKRSKKRRGKNDGGKNRKKRKKKKKEEKRREKRKKKGELNKTKGKNGRRKGRKKIE